MATTCFGGCARWKASLKERPGPPLRIRQSPVLPCAPGLHRSEDDGYTAANSGEAGEPSYRLRAGAQRMLLGPVCRVAVCRAWARRAAVSKVRLWSQSLLHWKPLQWPRGHAPLVSSHFRPLLQDRRTLSAFTCLYALRSPALLSFVAFQAWHVRLQSLE